MDELTFQLNIIFVVKCIDHNARTCVLLCTAYYSSVNTTHNNQHYIIIYSLSDTYTLWQNMHAIAYQHGGNFYIFFSFKINVCINF